MLAADPDASVDDFDKGADPSGCRWRLLADAHGDFTGLGELHRIAEQVEQDLADSCGVALHAAVFEALPVALDLQLLFTGVRGQQIHDAVGEAGQVEVRHLEAELPGFELGEVEQVVEDHQQAFGGILRRGGVGALLGVEL